LILARLFRIESGTGLILSILLGFLSLFLIHVTTKGSQTFVIKRPSISLALRIFFIPALLEEMFWRSVLLFFPTNPLCYFFSIIVFTIAHPALAYLGRNTSPSRYKTFSSFWFLLATLILGIYCSLATIISGSLIPGILFHWLLVYIWIDFGSGKNQLSGEESPLSA
jgi:predicted Abi (CAAX) family protease